MRGSHAVVRSLPVRACGLSVRAPGAPVPSTCVCRDMRAQGVSVPCACVCRGACAQGAPSPCACVCPRCAYSLRMRLLRVRLFPAHARATVRGPGCARSPRVCAMMRVRHDVCARGAPGPWACACCGALCSGRFRSLYALVDRVRFAEGAPSPCACVRHDARTSGAPAPCLCMCCGACAACVCFLHIPVCAVSRCGAVPQCVHSLCVIVGVVRVTQVHLFLLRACAAVRMSLVRQFPVRAHGHSACALDAPVH
jgi:hypothetical protein